jgi:hypothetical protein
MTERIDLKALKGRILSNNVGSLDLGIDAVMTLPNETIAALVACAETLAKVRSCRKGNAWVIGGRPGLTQLLPDMDAALHPFTEPT